MLTIAVGGFVIGAMMGAISYGLFVAMVKASDSGGGWFWPVVYLAYLVLLMGLGFGVFG